MAQDSCATAPFSRWWRLREFEPFQQMAQHVAMLKSNLLPAVIEIMDTKNLDLGLLVTLDALLAEGNVTRSM